MLRAFEALEKSPAYALAKSVNPDSVLLREDSPIMPAHVLVDRKKPDSESLPQLSPADYSAMVGMISKLFDSHPDAFRAAMQSVKAIHDMVQK